MIIVRSPLRISLGGGGTDLESYYSQNEGFLVAGAINKYIFVSVNQPFTDGYKLKYSEYENVTNINDIHHPIIREALKLFPSLPTSLEITSVADIPSGTGLGSSGSFTTALLKALAVTAGQSNTTEQLAELACHIEIDKIGEPIGKQDQYISAVGGLTSFTFAKDGKVKVRSVNLSENLMTKMNDNLLLFFTGLTRSASQVLQTQKQKTISNDADMIENLHRVKELGYESLKSLENSDFESFGKLMHVHWLNKKRRGKEMSNSSIDSYYELAMEAGAYGGKIVGAGGGGFLLIAASDADKIRSAMLSVGLREVPFEFDFEGTKSIT